MPRKNIQIYCRHCDSVRTFNNRCIILPNGQMICQECREKKELKVFKIGCFWNVAGHYEIAARSMEEAVAIAADPACNLPTDTADYIPGSFRIDKENCEELEDDEV